MIYLNIASGMIVHPKVIEKRVMSELPFMATENIMMSAVKKGGDRQELHEQIRIHSVAAGNRVKEEGLDNDLITRIANDPLFGLTEEEIRANLNPADFTGRSKGQVEEFLANCVAPALAKYEGDLDENAELNV